MSHTNSPIDVTGYSKGFPNRKRSNSAQPAGDGFAFDDENHSVLPARGQRTNLEELFSARTNDMRLYNFAWLFLQLKKDARFEDCNFGLKDATLDDIEQFVIGERSNNWKSSSLAKEILQEFNRRAVQPERLSWTLEKRASKWIKNKITPFDHHLVHKLPNIVDTQLAQTIFDVMETNILTKSAHLNDLKHKWEQNLKTDHHLRWLDDKEHGGERRKIAWTVLCEKYSTHFNIAFAPSKFHDFLEIFDQIDAEGFSKKDFIRSLRGKASKSKISDGGRKAKNLDISIENHTRLKALASLWGVHEFVAMDRLIAEAFTDQLENQRLSEI